MRTLEVWVNGERIGCFGHADADYVEATLFAHPQDAVFLAHTTGSVPGGAAVHHGWPLRTLQVGDEVRIVVSDTATPDPPDKSDNFGTLKRPGSVIEKRFCSFCATSVDNATRMVAGAGGNICGDCAQLVSQILDEP